MPALTLECFCADNATVCELSALYFEAATFGKQWGSVGALAGVTLTSSLGEAASFGSFPLDGASFSTSISTSIADLSVWQTLAVTLGLDQSLFQGPSDPIEFDVSFWIRARYICTDLATATVVKTRDIYSAPGADLGSATTNTAACVTGSGFTRSLVTGSGAGWVDEDGQQNYIAGGTLMLWESRPLGACNGSFITFGPGFIDRPKDQIIDMDAGTTVCLCADGGTEPYFFVVKDGRLPSGLTLNSSNGCLEGTATGPGSGDVTFLVVDAAGEEASVTCNFAKGCDGPIEPSVGNWFF